MWVDGEVSGGWERLVSNTAPGCTYGKCVGWLVGNTCWVFTVDFVAAVTTLEVRVGIARWALFLSGQVTENSRQTFDHVHVIGRL